MGFTAEEMNLACIFDISSRERPIRAMEGAIPHMEDPELAEYTASLAAVCGADSGRIELMEV